MTAVCRMMMKAFGRTAAALALVLTTPALAQNSDAPIDVTAAPPPSAETVGPAQLRDFNLQGTVTRPADRSAAPPQQVESPATPQQPTSGAPDSVETLGVATSRSTAPRAPAASAPRPAASSPADLLASGNSVTPSLPLDVTTDPAPQPTYDDAAGSADIPAGSGLLSWPWIAVLIALMGGGAFFAWSKYGRRRRSGDPGRMAFAGLVPDVAPGPAPMPAARPRPDPVPPRAQPKPAAAPAPKPAPANDGGIVSTRLKPQLNVEFQPDRAIVTENEALVQFDVVIVNSGSAPARDVLVEARLFTAHAAQDAEIGAFFQNPMTEGDRMTAIAPLGRISLKSIARLPLDQLHSFEVEGRRLFVPMIGFNILFRSNAGEGQASASFLVGRGNDDDEKLAPFRIDLGPRIFRGLSARPHSMGLQRAASA